MTQQNAALVEQSAAAAESLKEQAGRLAQAVAVFKFSRAEAGVVIAQAAASSRAVMPPASVAKATLKQPMLSSKPAATRTTRQPGSTAATATAAAGGANGAGGATPPAAAPAVPARVDRPAPKAGDDWEEF
jgi:hypothetical protein